VRGVGTDVRWAGAAALTVLLALALLMVGDHHYFWYGDTPAAYYGWWYHLGQMVRHGDWTNLDPHAWRAGNFAAEGQWGLWSPLTIGIGLLATVVSDLLALTVAVKLGLAVVGVLGVYLLVRSYDAPPAAAYIAAVLVPMGGMTQYLDLPSWVAAEMIWALFPWVWWGLRRTMLRGANPLPALAAGYLLVTVGYVFGTIMLIVAVVACLFDCYLARDRAAALRVLGAGLLLGLVAVTVYLPGVLTSHVTARETGVHLFGGKFTTDPLALFAGVLPTSAVPGTSASLLPYSYLAWLLPVACWLDLRRAREAWRPLGGLLLLTVVTLVTVDGISQLGALRWPLRLAPFLVLCLVVLLVVAWHRFGVAAPSRRRLAWSLGWVVVAAGLSLVRASSMWGAYLAALAAVAGALAAVWWLVRRGGLARAAPLIGVVTVGLMVLQHAFYPTPPSPQRHAPTALVDYRTPAGGAVGDVMEVGAANSMMTSHSAPTQDLLLASGWYLNPHDVQNTYTTISHDAYKARYCMTYLGDTCAEALSTLFSIEPITGRERVDLLGVSSLVLVRADYPARVLAHPPAGWRVAGETPYSVTWTRRTPIAGAGGVAWTSPGTSVSAVHAGTTSTTFRVDRVPATGGTVVLSLLDWPGYSTSSGSLAAPVDGYLVTLRLPASAQGQTVDVGFRPPGWWAELGAWALALLAGAAWSVAAAVHRRRSEPDARISRQNGLKQ
jgi:hypothetical protein